MCVIYSILEFCWLMLSPNFVVSFDELCFTGNKDDFLAFMTKKQFIAISVFAAVKII